MKYVFITLFLTLKATIASAIDFAGIGYEKEPIVEQKHEYVSGESVGEITHKILDALRTTTKLDYEGSESGVLRIAKLGNEIEVISDVEMKAYGWCYRVNKDVPEVMPDKYLDLKQDDKIIWFYAYSHYLKGVWINQCVPVRKIENYFY